MADVYTRLFDIHQYHHDATSQHACQHILLVHCFQKEHGCQSLLCRISSSHMIIIKLKHIGQFSEVGSGTCTAQLLKEGLTYCYTPVSTEME